MVMEQFQNNASTTLANSITAGATSIAVVSGASFPATGNFRVVIGIEIVLVTANSANTFTVLRGQENTTATPHPSGTSVLHELTQGSLLQFVGDAVLSGTYANLPSAAVAGRAQLDSDGPFWFQDTGSAWLPFGPVVPMTLPIDANYTWVNQGSALTSSANGSVVMTLQGAGSKQGRLRVLAVPATPYKITALLACVTEPIDYYNFGLIWRNSGAGTFVAFEMGQSTTYNMAVSKYNSPLSFNSSYKNVVANTLMQTGRPLWLRIADDGTNRLSSYSFDGSTFYTWHSVGRTDFLTADQVGWYVNNQNANAMQATLLSWVQN